MVTVAHVIFFTDGLEREMRVEIHHGLKNEEGKLICAKNIAFDSNDQAWELAQHIKNAYQQFLF